MKYRFNKLEKLDFKFEGLAKKSKRANPHKLISKYEFEAIMSKAKSNTRMDLIFHLLYDLAA